MDKELEGMGRTQNDFKEDRMKLREMQTSLDGDHGDRNGSKCPKIMPGLGWIHRITKKRKAEKEQGARI